MAFLYAYDDRGLVTDRDVRTDETTTSTSYVHDALGRLVESVTGGYVATYGWDAASNLVAETVSDDLSTNLADDGHVIVREVDAVNRTTVVVSDFDHYPQVHTTTTALSYDGRGNRTGELTTRTTGGTTHTLNQVSYVYDAMDQLVFSRDTGANQNSAKDDVVTSWSRDGMGRALVVWENAVRSVRVFDGVDAVVDGDVRVTRGPDGRVLAEEFETVVGHGRNAGLVTVRRDVLGDVLGSTVSVAEAGLISADLALFADFGDLLTEPERQTVTGFTGAVSSAGLVEFATRAYDPGTRVWVQADSYPGTAMRASSMNRYAYVEDAPESFTDGLGFARGEAAIDALKLSAVEAAYLMAIAAELRARPPLIDLMAQYEADMAQIARDAELSLGEEVLGSLGSFFWTFGSDAWETVRSSVEMSFFGETVKFLADPDYYWQEKSEQWQMAQQGWQAFRSDPGAAGSALWDAIKAPTVDCWNAGDYGCAVGHVTFAAAGLVAGGKGGPKLPFKAPTPAGTAAVQVPKVPIKAPTPAGAGASTVAANTAGAGAKPFAMGISEHLDDFAGAHGADTWKSLPDPVTWQPGVLQKLQDPGQRVLFNLDGVDVWPGVTRAAAGRGGATDWELLQMRNNSFPNLEFWKNGQRVGNPFE